MQRLIITIYTEGSYFFEKETKAIFTSSIVWTCLVGFFYLKEHTHIVDFCMIPVTLCGVLFIAKPPFIFGGSDYTHRYGIDSYIYELFYSEYFLLKSLKRHLLGFGSAFACAVLIGLMYLVLRKVGSDIHYTVMSFYYSLVGVISLGFIVLITSGFSTPCQVMHPKRLTVWTIRYGSYDSSHLLN